MSGAEPKPIVLDLEAGGDPDDLWMLLYLLAVQDAGKIRLRAVTVVGSPEEAGAVANILEQWGGPRRPPLGCGPLGIRHARREKSSPARYAKAEAVLVEALDGAAVVVTGGPLSNLARAAGSPQCPAIRTWPAEKSRTRVSLNFDRETFLRGLLLEG